MKNIKNYEAEKYTNSKYKMVEKGIYQIEEDDSILYVSSLSFVQEPEYDEGEDAENISQYPLEDILDKFFCYISDFYEDLNLKDSADCFLEFASYDIEDVRKLRGIIGKHVYNLSEENTNDGLVKLIIE